MFRNRYGDEPSHEDVLAWLIQSRCIPRNENHQIRLLSKVDQFEGLAGLVVEVLKVEASLSQVPGTAMADFLIVIEEELKKSKLPDDVLFGRSTGLHHYLEQAYSD